MRVAKWGNSLAIRIPKDVAQALKLEEGSEIEVVAMENGLGIARPLSQSEAMERIRKLAKPLPADWKFDREEAYAR